MVNMSPSEGFPAEFIVVGVGDIARIVIANSGCASDVSDGGSFSAIIGQSRCIYRVVNGVGKATDVVGDRFRNGDKRRDNGVSVTPSSIRSGTVLIRVDECFGAGAVRDVAVNKGLSDRLQNLPAGIRDGRKCDSIGCRHICAIHRACGVRLSDGERGRSVDENGLGYIGGVSAQITDSVGAKNGNVAIFWYRLILMG